MTDILLLIAWLFCIAAMCEVVYQKLYPKNEYASNAAMNKYIAVLKNIESASPDDLQFVYNTRDYYLSQKIELPTLDILPNPG